MKEILEFRTQTYKPRIPEKSNLFSGIEILDFKEEDPELPSLQIVYEVEADELFDSVLISQLIKDSFHDFFFKRDLVSNIQIVEEAILDVKNKILKILRSNDKNKLDFHLICGIFEKNNLSVVRYGNTKATLIREGDIKDLEFASEGYFGSAKGNVKNGDLLLLSTSKFHSEFVGQDILKKGINIDSTDLEPDASALILYFNRSQNPEEKNIVRLPSKKLRKKLQKTLLKYQGIFLLLLVFGFSFLGFRAYKDQEYQSLVKKDIEINNKTGDVLGKKFEDLPSYSSEILEQISIVSNSTLQNKDELVAKLRERYNEVNKIKEKEFRLLFDFKDLNPRAEITSFIVANSTFYILDIESSNIFYANVNDLKFESKQIAEKNPKTIDFLTRTILIHKDGSSSYYSLDLNKSDKDLEIPNIGISKTLLGNIYEITDNKINRIDTNSDNPQKVLWAESDLIKDAKDIDIDYDVYILDKNSQLLKFSQGSNVKMNFENPKFNLSHMYIDNSLKNYYFSHENRIYTFSKEGKFLNQIIDTSFSENINQFMIVNDSKIYIITDSKLYEVSL
jgi:mRNA-degrading endonuclease RelE of RelBE toxin-antitoxin system